MKFTSLHDDPFGLLCAQRASDARRDGPSIQEAVDGQDARLRAILQRREARWDNIAERTAIDREDIAELGQPTTGQMSLLPKMLSGSQGKTAFALQVNAKRMISEDGLDCTCFVTLTVGETGDDGKFRQVKDADEASRRINNLNRRFLPDLFKRAIVVTERHKSGAIHFHILGTLKSGVDIRTGFNHEAVKGRDYRSASPYLLGLWAMLREKLPGYGFGRAELTPIRKTGEAVASYVAKYIEKNVCNRKPQDKYKKLVRYLGWNGTQTKPNGFMWGTPRAVAWRARAKDSLALVGINQPWDGAAAAAFGPRWALAVTRLWIAVFGDEKSKYLKLNPDGKEEYFRPKFDCDFKEREFLRAELANLNENWCRKREGEKYLFSEEVAEIKASRLN